MWTGIIVIGYILGIGILLRFFHMVHQCDEEIVTMSDSMHTGKNIFDRVKSAA